METRRRSASRLPVCGAVLIALTAMVGTLPSARAGSVFMKNGYIIQGPIIEHSDDVTVLAWENGKIALPSRFIDEVSFDPGEKRRVEILRLERERELAEEERVLAEGTLAEEIDELPADLSVFLALYADEESRNLESETADFALGGGDAGDESATGGDGTSTPTTSVDVVDAPEAGLAPARVYSEDRALSLRPPKSWRVGDTKDGLSLRFVGPASERGVAPSFSVATLPGADTIALEQLVDAVRAEQGVALDDVEVLREGETRAVAEGRAFELVSRATRDGRTLIVRQVVIERGTSRWLVSEFVEDGAASRDALALIDEAVASLDFHD